MQVRFLTIAASLVALAGTANAGGNVYTERTQRWDFTVQTRYVAEQEFESVGNSKVSLEDDLGWGFGFGYNANERFNLGMMMSWRSISYNATIGDANDPTNFQSYGSWLDTGNFSVTAEYNILPQRFTPYVSGSLGWMWIDTNITADYSTGCWWDPWYGYVCSTYASTYGTDDFTYGFGAGLRLELAPTVFVRAGYEHNWVDVGDYDGADMIRIDLGFMN